MAEHRHTPDDTHAMPAEGTAAAAPPEPLPSLFQVSHPRLEAAHYALYDGHFVSVHRKRFLRPAIRYEVNLHLLDPTPRLVTETDRRWLVLAAVLVLAAGGLLAASLGSPTPWHQQAWMPGTILLMNGALLAFVIFLQRSQHLVRFHSRHGDAPLLVLQNNAPAGAPFRDFMQALLARIHEGQRLASRGRLRLGAELVEHRRLHAAGIIERATYDRARENILGTYQETHAERAAATASESTPSPPAGITVAEIAETEAHLRLFESRREVDTPPEPAADSALTRADADAG